jgi:hypothetical protein
MKETLISPSVEGRKSSHFFHTRFYTMNTAKGLAPHARFGGLLYACDLMPVIGR